MNICYNRSMKKEGYKKLVNYWKVTAAHDFETMESLFKAKRYDASLFFAHIVLEKILKALVVEKTGDHAPYTHDLVKLAQATQLIFNTQEIKLFNEVSDFNMDARYPEQKLEFYKICTKEYAENYIKKVKALYKKLCQKLKQQK